MAMCTGAGPVHPRVDVPLTPHLQAPQTAVLAQKQPPVFGYRYHVTYLSRAEALTI